MRKLENGGIGAAQAMSRLMCSECGRLAGVEVVVVVVRQPGKAGSVTAEMGDAIWTMMRCIAPAGIRRTAEALAGSLHCRQSMQLL